MAATFTTAEVEDGTGKSTALVYEQPSVAITWLNLRGKTSFSGSTDAQQKQYALEAVEECEDAIRGLLNGATPVDADQALLAPRRGWYDQQGKTFDEDELPAKLLEAIRLAEEEMAAGTWLPGLSEAGIEMERRGTRWVRYRDSIGGIKADHPDVYRRLIAVVPMARI